MLQRYNVLDLSDLRRAGKKASDYQGQPTPVRLFPAPEIRTGPVPAQGRAKSRRRRKADC